ncbi:acetyltransferase-like protein [Podospora didyma]|uniref:Acetyltransferase-like protein n=1 Tax=Podospora didyma TaxID=330526 RepID=A0AAE0NQF2_9PEZI|nr:acetyltransferase-like protein [Podospora didyma]
MATYTPDQLARYFEHIGWDASSWPPTGTLTAAFLQELIHRQLARVPFESVSLHYSPTHLLSLDPEDLFHKIVGRNMGGYCMENNTFFGTILRSLGFNVTNTGGRVSHATAGRPGPGYMGWNHMVNLVTIDNDKFLVDVGFGYNGPSQPLALESGVIVPGIGTALRFKLTYTALPQHTDKSQRMWVYSYREGSKAAWTDAYAFTEMEFFPDDFAVMNVATMTLRRSFFLQTLFCVKMTLDAETGEPSGWLLLNHDQVKRKDRDGATVLVAELKTEEERVAALEKWFDIQLTEKEKTGIRDLSTELRGWSMD